MDLHWTTKDTINELYLWESRIACFSMRDSDLIMLLMSTWQTSIHMSPVGSYTLYVVVTM